MSDLTIPSIDIETEDLQDSPEFQDAVRNAQLGQYEHTLLEIWTDILDGAIEQVSGPLTIALADGLLRQWPWLSYADLPGYLSTRKTLLQEALNTLVKQFPKPVEVLFQENVDDWEIHKDTYVDVIVEWTRLSNSWSAQWEALALQDPKKGLMHAAVADATSLLINPSTGLVEQLRNLAGFLITEEESGEIQARLIGEDDE